MVLKFGELFKSKFKLGIDFKSNVQETQINSLENISHNNNAANISQVEFVSSKIKKKKNLIFKFLIILKIIRRKAAG